ncbi:helix-turn-helix domain-containing protein [Sulfuricurvum sp.]|uniref:helix-turn-helix domain-containing protein n=1 Tax=Sulfuricurvum sp. TaxID=2025608 RepID=UPI003BB5F273
MDTFELHSSVEIAHEIGRRAKSLRKATKMTQKEFAEFSGIPFGTYMRFEQSGEISFQNFIIIIIQRLGRIEELESILLPRKAIKW